MNKLKPQAAGEPSKPYNPWREFIENCITGDNYFRRSEYTELLEYIDGLIADPAPMVTMDDGSSVHLDSYTGGAHEAGAWGELTLRFEHGGVATTRRYQEVAAPTPSPIACR